MCVRIRLQAINEYSLPKTKRHIYPWSKDQAVVAMENKLLWHIRRVGESKTWVCEVMRVTMDYSWTEHRLAMPGDDIHLRNIRNLAGRGRCSVRESGRMSTCDGGHENNRQ